MTDTWILTSTGFGLVLLGILLLIAAAILITVSRARNVKTKTAKTAGVIIIGPVPIVFGSDKKTVKTLLILSTALTLSLVAALLIYYFLFR